MYNLLLARLVNQITASRCFLLTLVKHILAEAMPPVGLIIFTNVTNNLGLQDICVDLCTYRNLMVKPLPVKFSFLRM